jgi:6-phosphofructo-2-kinase/fructose-2,6-biphosphatase 2
MVVLTTRAATHLYVTQPIEDVPTLDVPLHTVIELTPVAYGCEEMQYYLDRDDVENVKPRILTAVPTNQPPPPDPPSS